jgi:hypothetical protein
MGNHAKNFEKRKAAAEETMRWLLPEYHRADLAKRDTVEIKTKDLAELLAYVDAVRYREAVEFGGKHLGYCDPEAMRAMLSREKTSISCISKKSDRFCVAVSFLELPPKPLPKPEDLGIIESAEAVER